MLTDFDHNLHIFHSPKFKSVVNDAITFFNQTPAHQLSSSIRFTGAGVYGLYYLGNYELYAPLAKTNGESCTQPIYIGKAVPPGWRRGRVINSRTISLCQRLREHSRNLQQVANLRVEDFRCRFMMLSGIESDLVVPVEAELIRRYTPLWNSVVDGFGNHDPGAGRYNQARSEWDVLHPGRRWAQRLTDHSPLLADIVGKVNRFFELSPPP